MTTKTEKHPFMLAMSPITKTIFAGRLRQLEGYAEAVGQRHDVTSSFHACVIQFADSHGGSYTINENGKPAFEVKVRKLDAEAGAQP